MITTTHPGRAVLRALPLLLALPACQAHAETTADHDLAAAKAARALPRYTPKGKPTRYRRPSDSTLRRVLTPLQYAVARRDGTERPFRNAYWNNKRRGIYVDIVSGEPLFASLHKFSSGTGWPSFYTPLEPANVVRHSDTSYGVTRVEVRSKHGDSHLGHVFRDGPRPTGLRYCINSAALRFVPVGRLEAEGYGRYARLFTR